MTPSTDAFTNLISALNEGEEGFRNELLEECWSEDGRFIAPDTFGRSADRNGLSALVADKWRDREYWVVLEGTPHRQGSEVEATWEIKGSGPGFPNRQRVVATVDSKTDKLSHLTATPDPRRESPLSKLVPWLLDNPLALLPVALAVLYVVLRVPVTIFYNELSVTPQEVGLGDGEILRNSLLLLVFLVAGSALYGLVNVLLTQSWATLGDATERLRKRNRKKEARVALTPAVVAPLGVVFVSVLAWPPVSPRPAWVDIGSGVLALLAGSAACFGVLRFYSPAAAERDAVEDQRRRSGVGKVATGVAGIVITAGAIALFLFVPLRAYEAAVTVREGGKANGRLLPWRAIPAQVGRVDPEFEPEFENSCETLRYLGESNGRSVLYDTAEDNAIRISSDQIVVTLDPDCEPP